MSLDVAERLAQAGKEFAGADENGIGAVFHFLAVLHGTSDIDRLSALARVADRLANQSLSAFDGKEKTVPEQLESFIQEGILLAFEAMYDREWKEAGTMLARVRFLDDLLGKINRGEVLPTDVWPDVVGERD